MAARAARTSVARLRPEAVFLALTCSFGLAVLAANPPFQAPDETDHYARVFQLSEGTLIGEKRARTAGGELPRPAIDATNTYGIPFHYENKMTYALFRHWLHPVFVDWSQAPRAYHFFPHTVVYSPAAYLPQTAAVFVGRHLRIGPLGLMYLARLAAFGASVALGYAALRVLPIYRWTTLVLLLCPMSLYLFGSLASDGMLISGAALLVALLARLAVQRDRPAGPGEQAMQVALAGVLAVAKPVYLPLAGVALFVTLPRLASMRSRALFCAAIVACCLLPALAWARVAVAMFVPGKGDVPLDPVAQMHVVIGEPWAFLALVAHTIHVQYPDTLRWMVGTLGWIDTPMPGWFYPVFGFGVLGCLLLESDDARAVSGRLRAAMALAALASVLLIYVAQYGSWNPPGSREPIVGIEGRYFLPLLPLVVLSFPAVLVRAPGALTAALAGVLAVLCASTCLWAVFVRYYVAAPPLPSGHNPARLVGIAARALVGNNENILITGFAVGGNGLEKLLVRAAAAGLGDSGPSAALAAPTIRVLDSSGTVLASGAATGANASPGRARSPAGPDDPFGFPDAQASSEVVISVPQGRYSAEVSGPAGAGGLVLAEIREVSHGETRLVNVSTRGYVGRGANTMAVGFAVEGTGTEPLLARAVGPGLTPFGVSGALSRPTLAVRPVPPSGPPSVAWRTSQTDGDISAAASAVGAFALSADGADRVAVVSVRPGAYVMQVGGAGATTGVALAEIFELPGGGRW